MKRRDGTDDTVGGTPTRVSVEVARTRDLPPRRLDEIRTLLLDAFEGEFSDEDWSHSVGGWHVIAADPHPVAHAAVVPRTVELGGRSVRAGYVEGVATAPARQKQGLGSLVMEWAGRLIRSEFEIGVLSTERHAFYERSGWERWQGPTYVRADGELVRTADEDDGIMILRSDATSAASLNGPLCCESRDGDDW